MSNRYVSLQKPCYSSSLIYRYVSWTNPPSAGGTYNLSHQWSDRLQNWRERSPSSVLRNVVWDLRYLTCPQRYRDRDITEFGANSGSRITKVSIVLEDALRLGFSSILPNSGGKIVGSRASDGLVGTTGHRNHQKRSLDNVSGL